MNRFLYDSKSQGIRSGMNTDRGTDLVGRDLLYRKPKGAEAFHCVISECQSFLYVIAVADAYADLIRRKACLL